MMITIMTTSYNMKFNLYLKYTSGILLGSLYIYFCIMPVWILKSESKKKKLTPLQTKFPKENAIFNLKLIVSSGYSISTNIYPLILKQKAGAIYVILKYFAFINNSSFIVRSQKSVTSNATMPLNTNVRKVNQIVSPRKRLLNTAIWVKGLLEESLPKKNKRIKHKSFKAFCKDPEISSTESHICKSKWKAKMVFP